MNETYIAKKKELHPKWHFIDAKGKVLGKVSSEAAVLLMGKHKPTYTSSLVCGDKVVITNARSLDIGVKKAKKKLYQWYTGYPGGLRTETLEKRFSENPSKVLTAAVKGMLPKNKLRKEMMANLYVYPDESHPHQAQEKER